MRSRSRGRLAHLWSGEVSEHPEAYPCAGENAKKGFVLDAPTEQASVPRAPLVLSTHACP